MKDAPETNDTTDAPKKIKEGKGEEEKGEEVLAEFNLDNYDEEDDNGTELL